MKNWEYIENVKVKEEKNLKVKHFYVVEYTDLTPCVKVVFNPTKKVKELGNVDYAFKKAYVDIKGLEEFQVMEDNLGIMDLRIVKTIIFSIAKDRVVKVLGGKTKGFQHTQVENPKKGKTQALEMLMDYLEGNEEIDTLKGYYKKRGIAIDIINNEEGVITFGNEEWLIPNLKEEYALA